MKKKTARSVPNPFRQSYEVTLDYGTFQTGYLFPHHTKNEILQFFVSQKIGESVESISFNRTSPSTDGVVLLRAIPTSKGDNNG